MPVTFGGIITNIAKNYIKNQAKQRGLDFINRSIKNNFVKDGVFQIGKYYVYKPSYGVNFDFKDGYKAYKAIDKALKLGKSGNIKQLYSNSKNIYDKVASLNSKSKRINIRDLKQQEFVLNEFDSGIFKFSQKDDRKGKFTIDELIEHDNGAYFSSLSKHIGTNKNGEFIFGKYDANVIFKEFKDNTLTLTELKSNLLDKYKDLNEANRQFEMMAKRIEKNVEYGTIEYDIDKKLYRISEKGIIEAEAAKTNFVFSSYDANVILGYINRAEGILSTEQLHSFLDKEFKNAEDTFKQLEYISKRLEKNVEAGYLAHNEAGYFITEKGIEATKEFLANNIESVRVRLEILEKMGFVNLRHDGYIEVTDKLYISLEARNLINKQDIAPPEREKSFDDKFKITNFHRYLINQVEECQAGFNPLDFYKTLQNDIKVEDPLKKINSIIYSLEKLVDNGYLVKADDNYFTHSKTRFLTGIQLKDIDKKIYEFTQNKNFNGVFSIDDIVNFDSGRYFSDLSKYMPSKNKVKEFEFGKYDANIIFKEFTDNKLTLENLKNQLDIKFSTQEDADKQYTIISKRLDKLVKEEFVTYNDSTGVYKITEKGTEEAKNINSKFVFTGYDSNVLFGYINRAEGSLSIDQLYEYIKNEYKAPEEQLNQLDYITKRLNKNVESGYIDKDENNNYIITSKGKEEANYINDDMFKGLIEHIDILKDGGYLELLDNGKFKITERFNIEIQEYNLFKETKSSEITSKAIDTKKAGEFEITKFHKYVINFVEKFDNGVGPTEIFEKLKNDITVDNPANKANNILRSCKLLKDKGYLIESDGKYILHENTKSMMGTEFKFGYADLRIFRDIEQENGVLSLEKLQDKYSDDKYDMVLGRLKKLAKNGYIKESDNYFSQTELGIQKLKDFKQNIDNKFVKEFEFSKYDANVVFKYFGKNNSLTFENLNKNLLEIFNDSVKADKEFNILCSRINKNVDKGFINYNRETKEYSISEKGYDEAKRVRTEFKFTSYDANVIFGYINKADGKLSLKQLEEFLTQEYKSISDRLDKYDYLTRRIENNIKGGYLNKDKDGNFFITELGLNTSSEILEKQKDSNKFKVGESDNITIADRGIKSKDIDVSNFKLTAMDTEIMRLANKAPIDLNERLEQFRNRYKNNTKEIKRQIKMLEVRCQKLELTEYLDYKDNKYHLSNKGKELLNIKTNNKPIKEFVVGKYDLNNVFKYFSNNSTSLENVKLSLEQRYGNSNESNKQFNMISGRLKKLSENGYVVHDKLSGLFSITPKGLEEINNAKINLTKNLDEVRDIAKKYILKEDRIKHIEDLHTSSMIKTKTYFISSYDFKQGIHDTLIDEDTRIESNPGVNNVGDYCFYKTYTEPIGKDSSGKDLFTIKVILKDDGNVWTAYPVINDNIVIDRFNFTKFDLTNIIEASKDKIWSKEMIINKFDDLSENMLQNKIFSVEKRLKNLEELQAVKYIGHGKYELSDFYIERSYLSKEKGLDKFTKEQKQILFDLKDFYNLTDSQIEKYIFGEYFKFAKTDINKLVSNGYINYSSRDLYSNGEFTNIYYLTSKGKKAISHLSGHEIDKIFDSKLHNRPEELKHDLYVYSAYKDVSKYLTDANCEINKHYTDKDLRSQDMKLKGKQSIEYPDLRIEFTDIKTGEKGFINVEVDCGYKPNVIKSKSENIENLIWFTDSCKQAEKILNTVKDTKVIVIEL